MSEETEREVYRDGNRRIVVRQVSNLETTRSGDYCQLFVRLQPVAITIEEAGKSETIDLAQICPT